MTETTPFQSLDDVLEDILPTWLEQLQTEELPSGVLELFSHDGGHDLAGMDPRMDAFDMTLAARTLIYRMQPDFALFLCEGWGLAPEARTDDPDVRRAVMGETQLADLPPDKRWELLTLYAEAASGEHATRVYRITPSAERRALQLIDWGEEAQSRLYPLFLVDATLRDIEQGTDSLGPRDAEAEAADAVVMRMLRLLCQTIAPEERRRYVRSAVGQMLSHGAGGTSAGYEQVREERMTEWRQEILQRPARTQP